MLRSLYLSPFLILSYQSIFGGAGCAHLAKHPYCPPTLQSTPPSHKVISIGSTEIFISPPHLLPLPIFHLQMHRLHFLFLSPSPPLSLSPQPSLFHPTGKVAMSPLQDIHPRACYCRLPIRQDLTNRHQQAAALCQRHSTHNASSMAPSVVSIRRVRRRLCESAGHPAMLRQTKCGRRPRDWKC